MSQPDGKLKNQSNSLLQGAVGRQKLVKNALYSWLSASSDLLFLGLLILSGRYLGIEQFGVLSFGLATTTLLTFTTNLGLDSLAIRKIASRSITASSLIGWVLAWKSAISLIIVILFLLGVDALIADQTSRIVIYILAGAGLMRSFNMTMRAFLQAHEQFGLETAVVVTERVLLFVSGTVILVFGGDLLLFVAAFLFVRIGIFIVYIFVLMRFVTPITWGCDISYMLRSQLEALPLAVAILLNCFYMQADVLILSSMLTDEQVGLFSASFRLYEGLMVVPVILSSVVYPRLSSLFIVNKAKHFDLFTRSIKYIMIIALLILLEGMYFADDLIDIFYGEAYTQTSNVMRILMFAVFFSFCVAVMNVMYRSIGKEKTVLYITCIGVCAKVVLDILLIQVVGIQGAAVAVVISAILMVVVAAKSLLYLGYPVARIGVVLVKLCVSMGIAATMYLIEMPSIVTQAIGVAILYFVSLLALGIFDKYELEVVQQFAKNNLLARIVAR